MTRPDRSRPPPVWRAELVLGSPHACAGLVERRLWVRRVTARPRLVTASIVVAILASVLALAASRRRRAGVQVVVGNSAPAHRGGLAAVFVVTLDCRLADPGLARVPDAGSCVARFASG